MDQVDTIILDLGSDCFKAGLSCNYLKHDFQVSKFYQISFSKPKNNPNKLDLRLDTLNIGCHV